MVLYAHAFAIDLYKYDIGIQPMHIYFISLMCVYAIFVLSRSCKSRIFVDIQNPKVKHWMQNQGRRDQNLLTQCKSIYKTSH